MVINFYSTTLLYFPISYYLNNKIRSGTSTSDLLAWYTSNNIINVISIDDESISKRDSTYAEFEGVEIPGYGRFFVQSSFIYTIFQVLIRQYITGISNTKLLLSLYSSYYCDQNLATNPKWASKRTLIELFDFSLRGKPRKIFNFEANRGNLPNPFSYFHIIAQ